MSRVVVIAGFAESLIQFRLPFLQALVSAGHEVVALAPVHDDTIVRKLAEEKIQFRKYYLDRNGTNLLRDLRALVGLVFAFRELRPQVMFAYTIKPVIYGSLAARVVGLPRMYSMITGLGYAFLEGRRHSFLNQLVKWLYRLALKRNDRVFFQNPDDMALFIKEGLGVKVGQAIVVNGSGVDITHYQYSRPPEDGGYLMIARLLRNKGVKEYVDAARILRRRYPHTIFRLAGWIDENPDAFAQPELNEWIAEGAIEFLGRLHDVRPALNNCTVYVLPSYREGTPRSVLEAMATGRAVITADTPGCRETVIEGHNGFLVEVKSTESLVEAMEKFLQDPKLAVQMGLRSRQMAESRYDVRKVNAVLLQEMGLL